MIWDFSAILFFATLISGLLWWLDAKCFKPKRLSKNPNAKEPIWAEYARSFFPILLFVFLLRSFLVEPYRIPSGSMKPTLLVGDFILVNKFTYGIRLPILDKEIVTMNKPDRGDVMVFRFPPEPKINFIKRVIGLPGDKIIYKNKQLFVNGELISKTDSQVVNLTGHDGQSYRVREYTETLPPISHKIYEHLTPGKDAEVIVPEGHYFVMGDNRDESDDSRFWGFVPDENIIGKAFALWMSWDAEDFSVRFDRIGTAIK